MSESLADFPRLYNVLTCVPVKCEVMKRKDEPKRVKEMPTAPLVLMMVTGRVAKVAEVVAAIRKMKCF